MKMIKPLRFGLYGLVLLLLICGIASGASTPVAATTTSNANGGSATTPDSSSLVYISGVDSNPLVFYPYETGTITVHLTNSGTSSVGVSQPDLIDQHVRVINRNSFQTLSYIGPGATMDVSFVVTVSPPDGTYYPLFTIGTKDSSSIHFPIKVVVDSTDIRGSVVQKPDNFAISRTDMVNLSIVNPRSGPINNVIVTTSGTGVELSPSEAFISTLNPGSSTTLPFKVDPNQETNLTFHIAYQNGDNKHSTDVILPINIGEDKTGANPIINNVALTVVGNAYQMTGDVSNAGITDAKSMILTVKSPAKGVEPYANYAIGSLASDDFSSFTLTFTATDLSAVPVEVQWKDAEGNTFTSTNTLDLRTVAAGALSRTSGSGTTTGGLAAGGAGNAAGGAANRGGGGIAFGLGGGSRSGGLSTYYPVIAAGIIIVVGIVLYTKRKWIAKKLKKQ
jgi:hypothetical protein